MKKIFFCLMAFATMAMIGCSKDDEENNAANNEQHRSDGQNTALVEKAFTFQMSQSVNVNKKAGAIDLSTFVLNFINAQQVRVERAVADVSDVDTMYYSAAGEVVNYLLDENNHGAFTVSMDGVQYAFNFNLQGSDLSITLNGDSILATATRYTAGTTATDVMAGTTWEINTDLRNRVFGAAEEMINTTDFYTSFDAEGNVGTMTFANEMIPGGSITVGIAYDVHNMANFNYPYGNLTISATGMGAAFAGMITGVDYVLISSETLIIHMHITATLASMLGISSDITDLYVPMRSTNGGVTPTPGEDTTTTPNVEVEGTSWQFASGSLSGSITFTSAREGVMHITISGVGVNTDVPFTYVVRGNQIALTLDASDPYVAGLIAAERFTNPLVVTMSVTGDQVSFSMMGNTVEATPAEE
ncbi:MAG: hypothetical protein IJU90_06870 [Bacteroidales bacterium]|nr:hypothetical protein [Bacteroidales bacterium]